MKSVTNSDPLSHHTVLDFERFRSVWNTLAQDSSRTPQVSEHPEQVFFELAKLYSDEDRFYHSDVHINQCLAKMDEASEELGYHPTVEMAIWFHDAIYTAGDKQNEYKSALLFQDRCTDHLPENVIDEVMQLIDATVHRAYPTEEKAMLMVDVDLSSFSLPREQFLEDSRQIRREFDQSTTEEFIRGQSRFLSELLARPSVYSTRYFLDRYEERARSNIQHLLEYYERGESP